jgi:predicted HTH domain antitoxin
MERTSIELNLSRDLMDALKGPEGQREQRLRLLIALELFREERISSGKAAEVAGLSKAKFIDELGRREIPYFTETPEQLERQMEELRELFGGS